jgi:hypothetical protein
MQFENPRQITISAALRTGWEVHHTEVVGVHSDPDMDGTLLESEDHCYHTDPLSAQHCAFLESVGVVVVKGCRREAPGHHILSPLDNLEVVGIAAKRELLDDLRRCLGVECLQRAVAGCLRVRRKTVADYLEVLHRAIAGWED